MLSTDLLPPPTTNNRYVFVPGTVGKDIVRAIPVPPGAGFLKLVLIGGGGAGQSGYSNGVTSSGYLGDPAARTVGMFPTYMLPKTLYAVIGGGGVGPVGASNSAALSGTSGGTTAVFLTASGIADVSGGGTTPTADLLIEAPGGLQGDSAFNGTAAGAIQGLAKMGGIIDTTGPDNPIGGLYGTGTFGEYVANSSGRGATGTDSASGNAGAGADGSQVWIGIIPFSTSGGWGGNATAGVGNGGNGGNGVGYGAGGGGGGYSTGGVAGNGGNGGPGCLIMTWW